MMKALSANGSRLPQGGWRMRIDQPDPTDSGAPDAPRGAGAQRRDTTEAAAERAPRQETETAAERAPRQETETATGRTPRGETKGAPERTPRRETEGAPEHTPRRETEGAPEHTPRRETEAAPEAIARQEVRPPVSRADQIAAHLRYRETVSVSMQAAADRAAWAEALPQLRSAWAEHKERYPEQTRATPRTEPDGGWVCGEHRRLDPEQNTEASKAHADLADEADRHILPALRRVEAGDPDRQLAGLEHMVKGEDRLKEKMADELFGKDKTVREVLNEVPDAVRFTLRYDSGRYADGVSADVERLKGEGFELIKLKNFWEGDQYKGVNSQWRRPDSGSRFEMQFHTFESLEAKELTHGAYERIRGSAVTAAERREARVFQRRVNAALCTPPGTDRIKDYPEKANA
jgi:hypothetical protein